MWGVMIDRFVDCGLLISHAPTTGSEHQATDGELQPSLAMSLSEGASGRLRDQSGILTRTREWFLVFFLLVLDVAFARDRKGQTRLNRTAGG